MNTHEDTFACMHTHSHACTKHLALCRFAVEREALAAAIKQVQALILELSGLQKKDAITIGQLTQQALRLGNGVGSQGTDAATIRSQLSFMLARYGGEEATLWFEYFVCSLLSSSAEADLQRLNPFLVPATGDLLFARPTCPRATLYLSLSSVPFST